MMTAPLVSVVLPTYNCSRYIVDALESIVAQTYTNVEVIVVDDGSTDDTQSRLRDYRARIVYFRQSQAGLGAARNTGMRLARGEYIAWTDADDISEPDRLTFQVAYLTQNRDVVAIGSNFAAFDEHGCVFDQAYAAAYYSELAHHGLATLFDKSEKFDGGCADWLPRRLSPAHTVYSGEIWHRLLLGNFMHPPTMMFRASARERAGWLQESLRKNEDWEYITRVARLGPVAFVDGPLLRYRCHPNQMSSEKRSVDGLLNQIRVYEGHLRSYSWTDRELKRAITRRLAESHAEVSYILAEQDKVAALRHLAKAIRLDPEGSRGAFHLARILVPSIGLRMLRRFRRSSGPLRS